MENGKEVHTETASSLFRVHEEIPQITAPVLGNFGVFSVATSTVTVFMITVLFVFLCVKISRARLIPGSFQHGIEMLYEAIASFITSIVGTKEKADRNRKGP